MNCLTISTEHIRFTVHGFVCALFTSLVNAEPTRPNIIFIMAESLGCMDVGYFNLKTFYETPHIDSLGKRGMRFSQGYARVVSARRRGAAL